MNTNPKNRCRVLAIGEVLWDIIRGQEHIGGAPFNLAAHLAQLGCDAGIQTRVGSDARGLAAVKEMTRLGVDASLVQTDPRHPTGWALVELTETGVPTFSFPDDPAYNFIEADETTFGRLAAANYDAICFGTLQQKGDVTRATLRQLLEAVPAKVVFFDVNIRLDFYPKEILRQSLRHSNVVKLNADEAPLVAERLYGEQLSESDLAARLASDFPVRALLVTHGAEGCRVYHGGEARHLPGERVTVADTVGSGDAFSAAFLQRFCATGDPFEGARRGNLLGAYVASRPGAVPQYDETIRQRLA